jgi:hypothetical protein
MSDAKFELPGWRCRWSAAAEMTVVLFLARGDMTAGGSAVRAGAHLLGMRGAARPAKADRTGVALLHGRRVERDAEDQLLRADPNAVPLTQIGRPVNSPSIDPASVAALDVVDDGTSIVDDDPSVDPRNGRIEKRDLAIVTATDERDSEWEVELLKEESKAVPGR